MRSAVAGPSGVRGTRVRIIAGTPVLVSILTSRSDLDLGATRARAGHPVAARRVDVRAGARALGRAARCLPDRLILPGGRPSAWSGTTRAPGCTTRATRHSSGRGVSTSGTRSSLRPSSPDSNISRSSCSASACARHGWFPSSQVCVSVLLLGLGVRRIAGDLAGMLASGLLATNYVYVMYNRAAIMEALMTALIVASWYCSTRSTDRPRLGALAGLLAVLATSRRRPPRSIWVRWVLPRFSVWWSARTRTAIDRGSIDRPRYGRLRVSR